MKPAQAFLVAAALILCGCAHTYPSSDAALKGDQLKVPREFINGTASLAQAKAWTASLLSEPNAEPTLEIVEEDLNQDGTKDLLVAETHRAGTGGNSYLAFETTPKGYRYLGELFYGALRVLPKERTGSQKMLTMSCLGSGDCTVQLTMLDADGFHEVAKAEIAAGDSGTDEGNRLADALFRAETVSPEILKQVFGR